MQIRYIDKDGIERSIGNDYNILLHMEEKDYCTVRYVESIQKITYISNDFLCTLEEVETLAEEKFSFINTSFLYSNDIIYWEVFGKTKIAKMFTILYLLENIKHNSYYRWNVYLYFKRYKKESLLFSLNMSDYDYFQVFHSLADFGEEVNNSRSDNYIEYAMKGKLEEIGKKWLEDNNDECFYNFEFNGDIYSIEK